jgi:hypothetical protein
MYKVIYLFFDIAVYFRERKGEGKREKREERKKEKDRERERGMNEGRYVGRGRAEERKRHTCLFFCK